MINTHAKLLAIDFLSLAPTSSAPDPSFSLRTTTTSATTTTVSVFTRAETLGVVTTRDFKPGKFLRFTIDDGTGNIPCILWLNHLTSPFFSRRSPVDVRVIADVASGFASMVQLGAVARVRGRIGLFRGMVQLTVTDVVLERDPNAEMLHWLECVRLARRCYRAPKSST